MLLHSGIDPACPKGHTVSGAREVYLSFLCLHQEVRSWEITPNLCPRERTSTSYTSFLICASGINMHKQITRQIGIIVATGRHLGQEHIDEVSCKEIEKSK